MGYFVVFLLILANIAYADDAKFGQYNYSRYNAINRQLQYNRARTIRNQRFYNQNPTRNIIIPRGAATGYPNIERNNYLRNNSGNNGYQRYGY